MSLGAWDLHSMHTNGPRWLRDPEPGEALGPRLQEERQMTLRMRGCPSTCVTPSAKEAQSCSSVNTPQLSFSSLSSFGYHLLVSYLLHARLWTRLF